ncbi:CbtB-domain containing protein [Mycobacterium sp.]|uniref:CbtB domain-containing protein n=1 Tax=Mycobacterium sp. TaxID=1785 RepID=UPI0025CE2E73|nr:CbtB-domain containing protein [Mycobacterium sp.]MBW0013701.1 CbtB-domain containing protein [Mycobacterium sp.]
MASIPVSVPGRRVGVSADALSKGRVLAVLGVTVFLALLAYYFVGVDEGMVSVFGKTMVVHEWVHDARHFLGFPCH